MIVCEENLRLHEWKEVCSLRDVVGSCPLPAANLRHFVTGGAATHAPDNKQTCFADVPA